MRILVIIILLSALVGCAGILDDTSPIDNAIERYHAQAALVKLGDPKEKVLAVLGPTQEGLPAKGKKSSESFMKDKSVIEILFFRSGRQPDGLTTDDEFTPYVFTDGVLTAIGWTALGGPKTYGQVTPPSSNTVIQGGSGGGGVGSKGMVTCITGAAGMTVCQ